MIFCVFHSDFGVNMRGGQYGRRGLAGVSRSKSKAVQSELGLEVTHEGLRHHRLSRDPRLKGRFQEFWRAGNGRAYGIRAQVSQWALGYLVG